VNKFPVEASIMRFYFIHFCEASVKYLVILNRHYKKLCIKLVSKAFFFALVSIKQLVYGSLFKLAHACKKAEL
jgi:hypothetical protein